MQHEKFHSAPGSRVGTPAYLAPEVIMTTKGQTYDGKVKDSEILRDTPRAAPVVAAEECLHLANLLLHCILNKISRAFKDADFMHVSITGLRHLVLWSHAVRHARWWVPV